MTGVQTCALPICSSDPRPKSMRDAARYWSFGVLPNRLLTRRGWEMSSPPPTLPDLLSLIPEGNPKLVLRYCFDTLGLSVEETENTVNAALKLISSIDWLLRGGKISNSNEE